MASKKYLTESILRILKGGNIRSSSNILEADIHASMGRHINALLKMEAVNFTYPFGTSIPTHHMIATYEDVAVNEISDERSYCTLPATPVALPMQIGIWRISNCDHDFFIPLEPGMLNVASKVNHTALSAILGDELIAYEPAGSKVTFNKPKALVGDTVTVQLLTTDIASLDDYALLPIPTDMESTIVNLVVNDFKPRPHDDSNDANDTP